MLRTLQGIPRHRAAIGLPALAVAAALSACSSYVTSSQSLRPLLIQKDYGRALASLKGLDTGTSRLLYLYERGLILHQDNQFEASNAVLDSAETVWEDLYTRSVRREAGALLIGEMVREYRGERFEATLLHYYKIMNYLQLGQMEEAAVQCRRLEHRLQVLADAGEGCYRDDPFLRYLNGMVFERAGDANEADVALRNAWDLYPALSNAYGVEIPSRLACDLADNAARLGDAAAERQYRADGPCPAPVPASYGTLRLFLECGYVAYKDQVDVVLPIFKNEVYDGYDSNACARRLAGRRGQPVPPDVEVEYLLRVSMPRLVETPAGVQYARITAHAEADTARTRTTTVLGQNCTVLARAAFEEEQGTILFRTIVRGLAKYVAKKQAEKEGGEVAGAIVNLLGVATETADTRCWSTLPDRILVGSLDLPPGRYTLQVELFDRAGSIDDHFEIPGVEIRRGSASFLNYRIY